MPKRRRSFGRVGGRRAKRRRRRRHRYLILDDWSRGYSIREVDLSAEGSCRRCRGRRDRPHRRGEQCLPPAVFHLEAPRGWPFYVAAAFGTKIMAIHPRETPQNPGAQPRPRLRRPLSFGCRPDAKLVKALPVCIPVGDSLFDLCHESFHLLCSSPVDEPGGGQSCAAWTWRALPAPPFNVKFVTSYAVDPDGRTIFVTTRLFPDAAFSFHMPEETEEGFFGWKPRGTWLLLWTRYQGPAHLDRELNAWVGITCRPGYQDDYGYICACDVVPADPDAGDGQPPAWKLSKEKLFSEDPAETHVGATLLSMGGKCRYCLVQCVCVVEDEKGREE
ncbi:hypothetical protein BAE44_0004247 [Dichanthelium oligosanthes]|uniref:Uncharacterized protein n=1 Tax=Dichanthelium oligosanthes TaxID=888268 RepID=A0A1E5WBG9_9POAL|nr:hypothetical protein BAE44_0004247 [Dichanthelium oligosanthes]